MKTNLATYFDKNYLSKLNRIFNEFNYKLTYQKNINETFDKFKYTNIHYTK